jgi:hypothetical protein
MGAKISRKSMKAESEGHVQISLLFNPTLKLLGDLVWNPYGSLTMLEVYITVRSKKLLASVLANASFFALGPRHMTVPKANGFGTLLAQKLCSVEPLRRWA